MEKKTTLYKKFVSLLQDEWNCIAEYSIEALESIIHKKNDLVNQLQSLESERIRVMKKVAHGLKISHGSLTMKNLLKIQKNPINPRLARSRKNLLTQIQAVNNLNGSVRDLMDQSSSSFRKSLVHLYSVGATASSPYHANGKIEKAKIYSRMVSVDI
jgi:flagellar biosynthesis/type III secretory pathway chaperone